MSFDIGGFLGAIVGVIGAFLVAKWQFNKQREADKELSKEMFVRQKCIEDIDVYITNIVKLYRFINDKYLNIILHSFKTEDELRKTVFQLDKELDDLFNLTSIKETAFIGYDNIDDKILYDLKIKEKLNKVHNLRMKINYYIRDNHNNILILKTEKIFNDIVEQFSFEISKLSFIANIYKEYNLLRLKNESCDEQITNLLKEYNLKINDIDI